MPVEMLLQPLICIIYAKLFKAIPLKMRRWYHQYKCEYTALKTSIIDEYKPYTLNDSNPYISRILMDLPVQCLRTSSDLLIRSTSQSNMLAYISFANASLASIAWIWGNKWARHTTGDLSYNNRMDKKKNATPKECISDRLGIEG